MSEIDAVVEFIGEGGRDEGGRVWREGELLVHCRPSLHQPTRTRPARGLRDQKRGLGGGGWGKPNTSYINSLLSPTYANPSPKATAGSYA